MNYAVLTPTHSDASGLIRLAHCLAREPSQPLQWLILRHGEDVATREASRRIQQRLPFASELCFAGPREPNRGGLVAELLELGSATVSPEVDVIIKIDADVTFELGALDKLLAAFVADAALGMASGARLEQAGGRQVRHVPSGYFVNAQCRAYRMHCFRELLPLERRLGWDSVDNTRAVLNGWRTATTAMSFTHHRPIGARDGRRSRAHALEGTAAWYLGYRPTYLFARALHGSRLELSAVAQVGGYLAAAARHEQQAAADVRAAIRRRQTLRCLFRRAIFGESTRRIDVLLTADPGGHLTELLALRPVWSDLSHAWAIPRNGSSSAPDRERVHDLVGPTHRSVRAAFRNFLRSIRILRYERPAVIIAAGAASSVPMIWAAWLLGIPSIYLENSGRIGVSLSRRLVRPFVDRCYVQWPELIDGHPKTVYAGSALFDSR